MTISSNTNFAAYQSEPSNLLDTYTIVVEEIFDFAFARKILTHHNSSISNKNISKIVIDFKNTKMIKSCALGTLLKLKELGDHSNLHINFINCNWYAYRLFQICKFIHLFNIDRPIK